MIKFVAKARKIAEDAHDGQVDKAGDAYYFHPLSVSRMVNSNAEKAVAWLHDVVEDTDWTLDDLKAEGLPEYIVDAVGAITHGDDEPYGEYIARVKANPIAREVKIADLKHNLDLNRLPEVTVKDIERCRKYLDALQVLIS